MNQWQPYVDFWAPYLLAASAGFFAAFEKGKPVSAYIVLWRTGRAGLIGGSMAPLLMLPVAKYSRYVMPEGVVLDTKKITHALAVAFGVGALRLHDIRKAVLRMLGQDGDGENKNNKGDDL